MSSVSLYLEILYLATVQIEGELIANLFNQADAGGGKREAAGRAITIFSLALSGEVSFLHLTFAGPAVAVQEAKGRREIPFPRSRQLI